MKRLKLGLFLVAFGIFFIILGSINVFRYTVNLLPFYIIVFIGAFMFGIGSEILKSEK